MNQVMGCSGLLVVVPSGGCGRAVVCGPLEALPAGLADRFSSLVVFVVGGDVAERFVQPDFVVVDPDACQLVSSNAGSVMSSRWGHSCLMWLKKLSIQAWSVGCAGSAVVLGDGHHRHVGAGVVAGHGRAVVGHCEQDRPVGVVDVEIEAVVGEQLVEILG